MNGDDSFEFQDNQAAHRYELRKDGEVAGLAEYRREDDVITFTHTEVKPQHEGRGVGSRLARAALDDSRRQKLRVVPACRFIAAFVEKHPEYRDLVDRV